MAGVPSTALEGWAISIASSVFDHTYATSKCGLVWPCWGRSAGGGVICTGAGSSIIADCLSQVNSQAGIIYGVTGTCQQTANRILHPAGILVAAAGGYAASVFAWGVFGRGTWHQRNTCYSGGGGGGKFGSGIGGGPRVKDDKDNGSSDGGADKLSAYNRAVIMAQNSNMDDEGIRLAELSALIEYKLGEPLNKLTFLELASVQIYLWRSQEKLSNQLSEGKLGEKEYLEHLNRVLKNAMTKSKELLGVERFKIIFGDAGYLPEQMVDPDIFLKQKPTNS
jgi:hypothetical protein